MSPGFSRGEAESSHDHSPHLQMGDLGRPDTSSSSSSKEDSKEEEGALFHIKSPE